MPNQEPPRTTRSVPDAIGERWVLPGYGRRRSATHSSTFPASCSTPYGLAPEGCAVTGTVVTSSVIAWSQTMQRDSSKASPQGQRRPSVPRAAFSHSASVGSRFPAQVA